VLSTPVGRFRIIAFVEGVSFLVLLLIAMPIKYVEALGKNPTPVLYVGWTHGVLFVLYAVAGFQALFARGWGFKEAAWGFVAAILPAGTFVYDAKFLRREEEKELAERATASELQSKP
jgi:integral membrane protein